MTTDTPKAQPEGPSDIDARLDADSEFQRVLGNLARMPHKPHKEKDGREPKPAPKPD